MLEILTNPKFLYAFLLVFVCLGFGFFLRKKAIVGNEGKQVLKNVIWDLTLPCMAFSAFMQDFSFSDLKLGGAVLVGSFLLYIVFILLGKGIFYKAGTDKATVASLMAAIGQLTLFTMPLVAALGLTRVTFYCGIMTLSFRVALYFVAFPMIASQKSGLKEIKKVLLTPVMIAMFLGLIFWVLQNQLVIQEVRILRFDESIPAVFDVIKLLSSMVCPLAMMMIGMILGETSLKEAFTDPIVWVASLMRTFAIPLMVFLVTLLLPGLFDEYARTALVLGFAAPSSVTLCTFCMSANKEEILSSRIATVSTILSLIFIPLLTVLCLQ